MHHYELGRLHANQGHDKQWLDHAFLAVKTWDALGDQTSAARVLQHARESVQKLEDKEWKNYLAKLDENTQNATQSGHMSSDLKSIVLAQLNTIEKP